RRLALGVRGRNPPARSGARPGGGHLSAGVRPEALGDDHGEVPGPMIPSNRITHLADVYHRAEMSNGTSVPSNWALTSTGSNFGITWSPQAAGAPPTLSYGSNG